MFNENIVDISIDVVATGFLGLFFIYYWKTGKNIMRDIIYIVFKWISLRLLNI